MSFGISQKERPWDEINEADVRRRSLLYTRLSFIPMIYKRKVKVYTVWQIIYAIFWVANFSRTSPRKRPRMKITRDFARIRSHTILRRLTIGNGRSLSENVMFIQFAGKRIQNRVRMDELAFHMGHDSKSLRVSKL